MSDLILAHSPHGGAYTWEPVARILRSRGHRVDLPHYPPQPVSPFWRQHLDAIVQLVRGAGPLLAHAHAVRRFRSIYVDAGFRKDARAPVGMSIVPRGGGFVPAWANEDDLADLLPDLEMRRRLIASMDPLPREHFAEGIPYLEPPDDSAYVLLSPPYIEPATVARARGWPVRELGGENHYLMLADPATIADEVLALIIP